MDLVVKINDKCNFACNFCSSNQISLTHENLDINKIFEFVTNCNQPVQSIIVNGGDPLMVDPEYYEQLLVWLKENSPETHVSFTTNLLDFWEHPEKWLNLFNLNREDHISVCTSFQYGSGRRLKTGEVYTEDMFRKVFELFLNTIGERVPFISVISEENEDTAIKTVELAKELQTKCRLNPALCSGRTTKPYPFYKIVKIWLDIIDAGLDEYEMNCALLKQVTSDNVTECPFNPYCHKSISCLSPDGTQHTCPAVADDILKGVPEYFQGTGSTIPLEYRVIQEDKCYTCPMYSLCNSCTKRIMDIKDCLNIEEHCDGMNELYPRLKKLIEVLK